MAAGRPRVDGRRSGVLLTVLLVLLGGALIQGLQTHTTRPVAPERPDPRTDPAAHERSARAAEVRRRFDEAVVMLHAKRYDHATTALHRVLELAPKMPEAHVNMGFALLGLGRIAAARDFFHTATELAPMQANAYYGLAMACEALGDLPLALSAMRTFLHLARAEDQPYMARARAALWEWESRPAPASAPRN
jgi:Flp pilus assembly protein TadD